MGGKRVLLHARKQGYPIGVRDDRRPISAGVAIDRVYDPDVSGHG